MQQLQTERPDVEVAVQWKPFLLRPNMPEDGTPKAPDTPDNPRVGARLKAAGAAAGVNFTGKTDRSPNSSKAHALVKFFESGGEASSSSADIKIDAQLQDRLMNVIFRHYFTDGLYPDSANLTLALREALASPSSESGPSKEQQEELVRRAVAYMENPAHQAAVRAEATEYSRGGVRGVPYFFFDGRPAFSGAQPPSAIKETILTVADE